MAVGGSSTTECGANSAQASHRPEGVVEQIALDLRSGAVKRLGFGCGELYPEPNRAAAIDLLSCALDAGVSWFDTARLYGFGRAESLLGALTPRRRDGMIVVSKAGILPVEMTFSWRMRAKSAHLLRRVPLLGGLAPDIPPLRPKFDAFSPVELRDSVEKSLRELRTDYLDLLMLHECGPGAARDPEVLDLLRSLRKEGKIRGFGAAARTGATIEIARNAPDDLAALQFPAPPGDDLIGRLGDVGGRLIVTHSILGGFLRDFSVFMAENKARFAGPCAEMGVGVDDRSGWALRLLAMALRANRNGVVLFSSSKPENIRQSMTALEMTDNDVAQMPQLLSAFAASRKR